MIGAYCFPRDMAGGEILVVRPALSRSAALSPAPSGPESFLAFLPESDGCLTPLNRTRMLRCFVGGEPGTDCKSAALHRISVTFWETDGNRAEELTVLRRLVKSESRSKEENWCSVPAITTRLAPL